MIRQNIRMEYVDKIGENHLRFNRHSLVEWHLLHIAVDNTMLFPCIKIGISLVLLFKDIIAVFSFKAVDYSPVIGMCRIGIDCLIIKSHSARLLILFKEVVASRIPEQLGKETPSTYRLPVSASHLSAKDSRTSLHCINNTLQVVVSALYRLKC